LFPGKNSYTECDIARDLIGSALPEVKEVFGKTSVTEAVLDNSFTGEMTMKAAELLGHYAHGILASAEKGVSELKEKDMYDLYKEVELPLMFDLREMEAAGIGIDRNALKDYGSFLTTEIQKEEKEIYRIAGEDFNINSPKQLGEVLFEKLKLPGGKKTKSGYSTAAEVLEKLRYEDPIVDKILKYRELTKLKSTYADALGGFICPDGRIHTKFNQTVTMTGRLSSADPNLQNIPVRRESGREIRKMFVPKEGCCFVDADYSQIELRLLAHMSGDESLIQAYSSGQDIHRITAAKVFGVEPDDVTKEMRSNAKAVNFGIIYGIGAFSLAKDIGTSVAKAKKYIADYLAKYPKVNEFMETTVDSAFKEGYVTTMFGRKRRIPELSSSNKMLQAAGKRIAMNTPVQGTAADLIKIAMINVYNRLKAEKLDAKLILQVHDELIIESDISCADKCAELLKEEMQGVYDMKVPLAVDVHQGKSWYDAKG
jgi:DNA polymerase-1